MQPASLLMILSVCLALGLSSCGKSKAPHPAEPEVRQHLETYFASWSSQDMDRYATCFHEHARISYLPAPGAAPRTDSLSDFLYGQRMGHKTAPEKMVEIPLSMKVQMEDNAAHALVRWELTKGTLVTTGTDFFTLIRTPGGWKIINLVFYAD